MAPPLVSVVIPTYNRPALLAETLESVFAQTFTDYEVIVVNDGSTDDTEARLRAYGDRIRLISQPNQGIGAARNRGIDEARGRYVALLDHDDLWRPQKLSTQVAFFERHPECAAVSVPYAYSTSPDKCVYDLRIRGSDGIVCNAMQAYATGEQFILSAALMFDREKAAGLRYEIERNSIEDLAFHIRLLGRGAFGIAGDSVLAIYRLHEGNTSGSAAHFYNGMRRLRQIDRAGGFEPLTPADRRAVKKFLAFWGRIAAVRQLMAGLRGRAALTYLREFPHQARLGRFKFLLTYPAFLLAPRAVIRKRWQGTART
jgi:glycosyltransferase involved in cell wall biosynthesis